jgi:hypothetical protein
MDFDFLKPIIDFLNLYGVLALIVSIVVLPEIINIRKRSAVHLDLESNSRE